MNLYRRIFTNSPLLLGIEHHGIEVRIGYEVINANEARISKEAVRDLLFSTLDSYVHASRHWGPGKIDTIWRDFGNFNV